jgi:hypothetical protein
MVYGLILIAGQWLVGTPATEEETKLQIKRDRVNQHQFLEFFSFPSLFFTFDFFFPW